ncbi:RlpA-like double-psi beta-barrel-protein domain-containing protein-containing protein [Ganoderma leucocontextum]|nr:RlpA-like double-psi beta-barrel-protein domain-containing protein-containing protein [Ganoderma leucocontextum]
MFSSLWGFALLSLALPHTTVASSHQGLSHRRHEAIAHAVNNVTEAAEGEVAALQRRGTTYTNARLTYYAVGLGACGKNNVPSDFIVALNSGMFGSGYPGPNCFRPIAITYNGKTANAVIMDEQPLKIIVQCPGCPSNGGLDLSEGLFSYLAPLSDGVLSASWRFTDEGDDGNSGGSQPTTTTTHKTTHTTTSSTSKWTPTTTWEAPTTTSTTKSTHSKTTTTTTSTSTSTHSSTHSTTSSKPTTTSQSSTSTSSTSSFSSSSSHSSSSSSAAPTVTQVGSIEKLNQAFVGIVDLMIGAAQAA